MFEQLCKQHFSIILFRQPIFTSKTYSHAVTYNYASTDGNLLNLKKGQRLAEITIAECAENKPIEINSVCSNNFDIKEIDLSHWPNGFAKD